MLEVRSRKWYGTAAFNHAAKLSVLVSTLCRYAGGAACGDSSNWWSLRDPRANIISGNGVAHCNLPKSSALSVNQQSQPSADGIVKASSIVTLLGCDISCQHRSKQVPIQDTVNKHGASPYLAAVASRPRFGCYSPLPAGACWGLL
jgi:hypothetical protein